MAEITIGILIPRLKSGGIFQYALSVADSLIKHSSKFSYSIICNDKGVLDQLIDSKNSSSYILRKKGSIASNAGLFLNLAMNCSCFNMQDSDEATQLKNSNIKLLIIPFPSLFGFRSRIPYVVGIPDMMYKYYPSFPEFSLKERLRRGLVYKNATKNSILSIVDAQQGSDDLNRFFGISKEKVRIIPFIPPGYIYKYKDMNLETATEVLKTHKLPERFLFYPAQFWFHKNHNRLVNALEQVKRKQGVRIPLVLVGSQQINYHRIMDFVDKLGLQEQVISLGYVSDVEMIALYKKCTALIFPSLFGPTNIPPVEAMILGAPVICSNLFCMPEQIGNAGLFFNPNDTEDLAKKIYHIWSDDKLRSGLIKKGHERVRDLTLENHAMQWEKVIAEALLRIDKC